MPWQYGPRRFEVPYDEASLIQLNTPIRGVLRAFRMFSPDTINGSFEIYTNVDAARSRVSELAGSSGSLASGISPSSYKLLEDQLVDGEFETRTLDIPYVNADGTGPTSREGRLWMVFTPPEGSGATVPIPYEIAMTIDTPVF